LLLRFEFDWHIAFSGQPVIVPALLLATTRIIACAIFGNLTESWRRFSMFELGRVLKAHITSSILFAAGIFILRIDEFPRSVLILEFILSLVAILGTRTALRVYFERADTDGGVRALQQQCVIIGAGDTGHLVVRTLRSYPGHTLSPIAAFDDNPRGVGGSVHGVPLRGKIGELAPFLVRNPACRIVVCAIPSISPTLLATLEEVARGAGARLLKLSSPLDLIVSEGLPSDVPIEKLLDRSYVIEQLELTRSFFPGKTVMVTGAGGSIGSELVSQLCGLGVAKLTLLDNCEFNLFQLEREVLAHHPRIPVVSVLADIRNRDRMSELISASSPDVIFHAAAYKHVHLTERCPREAFENNVLATQSLIELAREHAVGRFVLISTDKAVNPSGVLGYTKRIAELLIDEARAIPSSTIYSAVRFGNVINSTGSVIPLFRDQIRSGGPITVTHAEAERYFMSLQEAVRLVLAAAAMSASVGGGLYVLDMGQKVKILDLARRMLDLYGHPEIPIVFTGLREGERLTEEIVGREEILQETGVEKIGVVITEGSQLQKGKIANAILERDWNRISLKQIAEARA